MKNLYKWILMAALSFSVTSFANTFTADLSDLWYNERESGWGVNVTHQRDILFLTFFIYGTDGRASWYTGQAAYIGQNTRGALVFTGDTYQFTGPYFGNFFNPVLVNGRNAGTLTFSAFLDSAILTYTIDGVSVTKSVTRQTFRNNDLTGQYTGAIKQNQSACQAPYINGDFNTSTDFSVANTSTTFLMTVRQPDGSFCSYSGNYIQNGRLGRSQGNYTCPGGISGTYDAFEIEANIQGFLGRYVANNNVCGSVSGRFAAMRK